MNGWGWDTFLELFVRGGPAEQAARDRAGSTEFPPDIAPIPAR